MSDRAQNIADMFTATLAFNAANQGDYSGIALAATNFAIVQTSADAMEAFFAEQTSGERAAAVEQKSVLKAAIRRKMKEFSKTARALNLDAPGFDKLFLVPDGKNEGDLIASAREFVKQATTHEPEFTSLGLSKNLKTQLQADIDAFDTADTAKADAQSGTVGATAGIDNSIDVGMDAEIVLDAIMNNVYRNDPVKRAAWKTARHIKRAPRPATPPTP